MKNLPQFESIDNCKSERDKRLAELIKFGTSESNNLANLLKSCTSKSQCVSAACPLCWRVWRKKLIRTVTSTTVDHVNQGLVLTILYFQDALDDDDVQGFHPDTLKLRLKRVLERAGVSGPAIGGLEADFHPEVMKWIPHFHILCFGEQPRIESVRTTLLKKTTNIYPDRKPRPMLIQKLNDIHEQVSYLFKSYWTERRRFETSNGMRTKKYRLCKKRSAMALLAMHRAGFAGLLFSYKIPRSGHPFSKLLSRQRTNGDDG